MHVACLEDNLPGVKTHDYKVYWKLKLCADCDKSDRRDLKLSKGSFAKTCYDNRLK